MPSDDEPPADLESLRSEVAALSERVAALEAEIDPETSPDPNESVGTPSDSSPSRVPDADPAPDGPVATGTRDLERDIGIKWLGIVGAIALVIGVVYFIRVAIDAGLIGPLGRVVIGMMAGIVIAALGSLAVSRPRYDRWGRITAGTGLAIAYFSLYAAYGFESYRHAIGTPLWLVVMGLSAIVLGAVFLATRTDAPVIAGEAFLLGYLTAYVGLEATTFVVTPVYALLLAGGLVALASVRPWHRLVLASVLPTYGLIWMWMVDLDPPAPMVVGVAATAFGIYCVGGYRFRGIGDGDELFAPTLAALTGLNGILAAGILEVAVRAWADPVAVDGLGVAAVSVVLFGVYGLTRRGSVRQNASAATIATVLLATAVMLAAGPFIATLGLLGITIAAAGLAGMLRTPAFAVGAHVVAVGTVLKLLLVDASTLPPADFADPRATLTGRVVAFAVVAVGFYGLAWWFRHRRDGFPPVTDRFAIAPAYAWTASGVLVVILALELDGVVLSIALAGFGLVLVGGGISADIRGLRYQGVAVLGLVTAKIFLFDTRDLDMVARTLSFVAVGAVLLIASYAYARWQGEDPVGRVMDSK